MTVPVLDARSARKRNVTIKDLATELGLSITTISRALNGYDDVGPQTRERVRAKATEMGYHPNRNAQRLVMQRTRSIAWIQSADEDKMLDPHFVEVMAGVLGSARAHNYDIVLRGEPEANQIAAYESYVRDNSVDGFILDLPTPNDPRIDFLLAHDKPFCVHGRSKRSSEHAWVSVDNAGNFNKLTKLLVANGHRRFAFINGDERYSFAASRHRGVIEALDEVGLPHSAVDIYASRHPMGLTGFQMTAKALEKPDITAIIYSSVLMATEGQPALNAAGRFAGENMCVATMDDQLHYLDVSQYEGKFTFVRSSLKEAGAVIVDGLIAQCERGAPPIQRLIASRFVLGDDLDGSKLPELQLD